MDMTEINASVGRPSSAPAPMGPLPLGVTGKLMAEVSPVKYTLPNGSTGNLVVYVYVHDVIFGAVLNEPPRNELYSKMFPFGFNFEIKMLSQARPY